MLTGDQIKKYYIDEYIHISPYTESNIGPNSYDVRLSNKLLVYQNTVLDSKKENKTYEIIIPETGYTLQSNTLYLGSTIEEIGSDYFVPMYEGRSSLARLGIQSHISAGFGDIGFKSKWTLEITVVNPVKIYPGIRIGQVYFHQISTINMDYFNIIKPKLYSGKYLQQTSPQSSKLYQDRELNK